MPVIEIFFGNVPKFHQLRYFSKFFLKTEAEHVFEMFLKYPKNRASCSYKLRSYKKSLQDLRFIGLNF